MPGKKKPEILTLEKWNWIFMAFLRKVTSFLLVYSAAFLVLGFLFCYFAYQRPSVTSAEAPEFHLEENLVSSVKSKGNGRLDIYFFLQNRRKMNRLQALLNESLIGTKHVENAAIIDIKERKVYASTFGFNVSPENALNLISTFSKKLLQVRKGGLYFKDKYYKCVRADEHSIYLRNPEGGLIVAKTKIFILVATYRVGMYPSVCVEAVEKLADYFREKGS